MKSRHSIDMCNGPVTRKILLFSLPIMFSSILQLLYNAADIAVIGRFSGNESLAAVGSTGPLINLFINFFMGISTGACITLANAIGMNDKQRASRIVHTSIAISVICGIIVGIAGILTSPVLLQIVNSPPDVIDKSTLYMKTYFIGMPALMIYNFGSSLLRAVGDTKRPMYILIFSGLINVIFNLIFVISFHLDVLGVAVATVISQVVSAVMVILCLIKNDDFCKYTFPKTKVHKKELFLILRAGIPAGIQGSVFSISNIQIQSAVNAFGSSVVAANSTAGSIEGFVYVAMNAIYQAALTFTSQNYGAYKPERIKKVLLSCFCIVTAIGLILGITSIIFAPQLISIYTTDTSIIPEGTLRLKYICGFYFLCGLMEVLTGTLRGMNHSLMPMITSIIGVCGIRMCWIAFVFPLFNTTKILYVSYPISWTITALAHLLCFLIVFKKVASLKTLRQGANQ